MIDKTKRYKIETLVGSGWWQVSGSYDQQSDAFTHARAAKRTGDYVVRVVDSRSGAVVPVPR